jgi:hypothetical protein
LRWTARRAGGGAPADLGDQLGPELGALAGDVAQAQARTSTPSTGGPWRGRGARTAPGHQLGGDRGGGLAEPMVEEYARLGARP